MNKKTLLNFWLLLLCMIVGASSAWADDSVVTWNINGVNTTASGGTNVNTTLRTSSVSPNTETGVWTAVASTSYAGSNSGAQLGSSSYTFAGTVTLSGSSIPSTATIKSVDITLSSSGTAYKIDAKVGSTTFGSQVSVNQKASKTYTFSGSVVGNSITLTFSNGGKKNVIITNISVTYSTVAKTTAPEIDGGGAASEFNFSKDVTISATDGATIYYTTDGNNPTTSSDVYSSAIHITGTTTIKAAAKEDGKDLSDVSSKTFTKVLADNGITVEDGNIHNITLTGEGAVTEHTLEATATSGGTVTYAVKSATNLTEGTDFTFNTSTHKISFTNPYKGSIVITASVAANDDYAAASQDITINCSGNKRAPVIAYDGEDTELSSSGTLVIDEDLIETDGPITVESSNTEVATVSDYTISPVADGITKITITTGEGTYYNAGSGSFDLTVVTPVGCDIALTGAPAKTFDLYNNANQQVINYTTSSTGTVSIAANAYANFSIDQVNKKITITPKAKTPSTQTITINQAAAGKYLAGSTTFSLTVNNSATSETYEKVTNDKTLAVDDELAIVNESYSKAAGGVSSDLLSPISVEITSNTFGTTSGVVTYILGGTSGDWTLKKKDDTNYLSSSTAKKMALLSSDYCTWAISISEGNATITSSAITGGNLQYNYNGGTDRFTTYTSTQSPVQLYRRAKYANTITVTNGTSQTLTLSEATSLTLSSTSYCGAVSYTYKSASNLTKDTDFTFNSETGELVVNEDAPSGTITITASTVESATHKAASTDIVITVVGKSKSDVEFALEDQSKLAGATYTLVNGEDFETDGVVTLSSSNTSVATVNSSTLTVTAVAVGSAKITVSCAEGTLYNEGKDDFTFTVTAPAGKTTVSDVVLFNETFASTSGPYDEGIFSGSSANSVTPDETGWTFTQENGGNKCAKFGSSSSAGSAQTRSITVTNGKTYNLTFKCAPWSDGTDGVKVTVTNGTINGNESVTTGELTSGKWNSKEYTIVATSSTMSIKFEKGGTENRFFLDDIKVTTSPTATVTLNKDGYATYCSVNPIDFSSTTGYTAWRVSNIAESGVITFTKITEKIKGGQGVLLYNKNADHENTSTATIKFADGTTEFTSSENLLVGTTAPTFVEQTISPNTNFVLSSKYSDFRIIKDGGMVVPANKAYLPVLTDNIPAGARLTFVFEDDQTTTIQGVSVRKTAPDTYYNMKGQRVDNPKKGGIYVKNGKKVIFK